MTTPRGVTALLLAGNRPGPDPLASAFDVTAKALIPIAGEAMLSRVARTLVEHSAIDRVIVLAQDAAMLMAQADTGWMATHAKISAEAAVPSVSLTVLGATERHADAFPFLVTTADHPLLDGAMLDAFLEPALATGADVAVALVSRRVLEAQYAENRRTWLRFRGGSYSGANLFLLGSPRAGVALKLWRTIEMQRKRGRAIVAAFGPLILIGVATRMLTLHGALRAAGRRLGITAAAIELPIAEACIDVDKPDDHALATTILRARESPDIRHNQPLAARP